MEKRAKCIGILTAGGDCPGLNPVIRGIAKSAMHYGIRVLGIQDGFRGLVERRVVPLDQLQVSGILTVGGTILGSSRDKPHKFPMGGKILDMTDVAAENVEKMHIDCVVCLGGNGTQKNALRLAKKGVNVITLPKTIDNDVYGTDITFGFDTALGIATEAIDRLHTTATSHHRIIACEIMGHKAGWLALEAGIAGGADAILIPEIPYNLEDLANFLMARRRSNKRFSIIAVAEGALSQSDAKEKLEKISKKTIAKEAKKKEKTEAKGYIPSVGSKIASKLGEMIDVDVRVTALGHVQRGGTPSARDRVLCTRLGTAVADLLLKGEYGKMIAIKGSKCVAVDLEEVAGKIKTVPTDHDLIKAAKLVETSFGNIEIDRL